MTTETTVDQTASAPAPVENAAPTPADEVKAPELGSTDTPASAAETQEKPDEKSKPSPGVQKRINELTRDKYQLKNENDELRKRLDDIERKIQPQEPVKPKLADFGSDAEYESAMELYYHAKAEHDSLKARQAQTNEQRDRQKLETKAEAERKFATNLQKEKGNFQDFDAVMADPAFVLITKQMNPEIVTLIQGSDKNIALAYHLGTHLEDAERIASLPPVLAARELAHLESRLETPKPKTVTNAPTPVKPVAGGSVNQKDISDPNLSDKEFNEMRRKQIAARRGR